MKIKKFINALIAVAITGAIAISSSSYIYATEINFTDTKGHWAENDIKTWTDYGVITGYEDTTFKPSAYITRGEVACILDRIFKYKVTSENVFKDLKEKFYTNPLLKLHNKSIINGYPDGTVQADRFITRQEMVTILNNVFKFEKTDDNKTLFFSDKELVSEWALDATIAFAERGYIKGDDSGAFNPQDNITRAEVVTILENIIGDLYNDSKVYEENKGKISIINTPDVTLKDITLKQPLIIAEGVGEGDVIFDGIKATEDITVNGGGENSIVIKGDSTIKNIIAKKEESGVRIVIEGGGNVETIYIEDGSDKVIITGVVDTVVIDSALNDILFVGATVDKVIVSGEGTSIEVDEDTKIDRVVVNETAKDTTLEVDGEIGKLTSDAENTIVNENENVGGGGGGNGGGNTKPPVEPPVEPPVKPTHYNVIINVDGHGYITAEKMDEIEPPIKPPIKPPVGEKPNVIIIIDGKGSVSAELVEDIDPEIPLPEGKYEVKIDVDGKGTIIIEKIN